MTRLSFWFVAAPLLAACSDPAATSPDDPDPSPPGGRTIAARDVLAFRGADGNTVEWPTDLDAAVVQLYTRDTAGQWTTTAGEGTSAGSLRVPHAPSEGGWLRVDYFDPSPEPRPRNELFWIDGEAADVSLDLSTWRHGRLDARIATSVPTELKLQVSNLVPWISARDRLVMYAPNVGFVQVFSQDGGGITGMPADGATGTTLSVDWAGALSAPLLDASRGDRAFAMQLRFVRFDQTWVGTPVRAVQLAPLTQTNGSSATTAATLADATRVDFSLTMDNAAFDALRPSIGRTVGPALGRGFSISSSPGGIPVAEDMSRLSTPAELVVVEGDELLATGLFDKGPYWFSSPFPASAIYGHFASAYPVMVARDDGFVAQAQAEIGVLTNVLPTETAPAAPIVGPVREITIAGRPAFDAPLGVGLTPEIRWQAPALGTPVEYEVKILAPGGADPTYDFVWYPSAIFHVPGDQTSLVLPPEILEPGLPYALAIRAIAQPLGRDVLSTHPRQLALPYGWADAITPAFKP